MANSLPDGRDLNSTDTTLRTFAEFRDTGLLWLVNATVFHPRGFALAFVFDTDRNVIGWRLLGNGKEPWFFGDVPPTADERKTFGAQSVDELFANTERLWQVARRG